MPVELKTLSISVDIAGADNKFIASFASNGYFQLLSFHQVS
jgi:hypothetical protein